MASGIFDDALIKHLWSSEECRAIFCDENRVRKRYEFEAALAIEQAAMGIIPQAAADEIVARVKDAKIDIEAIGAEIRRIKHPLVPALKALQAQCKGDLGEYIHFGPTTQDILDTGTVLHMRDIHAIYLRDLKAIGRDLHRLSKTHRATPMVGRTHGVQALPITFGHKSAIWLSELGRHYERLRELEKKMLVRILTEPKNSIYNQFREIFKNENVDLTVEDKVFGQIADIAIEYRTGARSLRGIFEELIMPVLYAVPDDTTIRGVTITSMFSAPVYTREAKT